MQRVRRWLSWLWPVFAAGFLFVQLVDAEEWARHTLPHVGPPSREMLVALDREHTMTMGALHARVERVEVTFTYGDGSPVDFNGVDHSITLLFNTVQGSVDEISI